MTAVGYVKDGETIAASQFMSWFITGRDRLVCLIDVLVCCLAVKCDADFLPWLVPFFVCDN